MSIIGNRKLNLRKIFLTLALVLVSTQSMAASQIEAEWSYPDTVTDITGFKIYQNGNAVPVIDIKDKAARVATIPMPNLSSGQTCFYMTAYDAKQESAHSNEYCIDPLPVAPDGLKITVTISVSKIQ
jgi:hypothetical protein